MDNNGVCILSLDALTLRWHPNPNDSLLTSLFRSCEPLPEKTDPRRQIVVFMFAFFQRNHTRGLALSSEATYCLAESANLISETT
jgi:hypothetical protein